MTRTKLRLVRRIALGLAIAAVVPTIAQARAVDMSGTDLRSLHAEALASSQSNLAADVRALHAEALASSQYKLGPGEIPSSEGFPWPSSEQGMPPTVAEDAGGYEIDSGVVSSAVMILLLVVGGSIVAVRHVRETRPAPA
jgi:hypothetical protein